MKQNHIVPLYVSKVPLLGFWTTIVVYVTDRQGCGLMLFAPCGTGTDHNNYLDPLATIPSMLPQQNPGTKLE